MQKPNGFDEVKVGGNWEAPKLGGHKAVIKDVREQQTSTGKPQLIVFFDFDKSDAQPEYFTKAYKEDTRENKKWAFAGTKYVFVNDNEGKTSKDFKGFCTSVEESNPGFKIPWGDGFAQSFKGKKVGIVFGETQYLNDKNEVKTSSNPRWFCSYDKSATAEIPKVKELSATDKAKANGMPTQGQSVADFMSVPDTLDSELPFC